MELLGEGAALLTSVLWTACAILFSSAGKRIGALNVNALRIAMAVGLLSIGHLVIIGSIIPQATNGQWLYMGLSGIIGLALGDFGYLGALVLIGPRRGVLLMSTAPIFSTIFAYFILGELLGVWAIVGIAVTLSGITLAILDEQDKTDVKALTKRHLTIGYLLALGGSLGQGVGLVVSNYGMRYASPGLPLDPLSATLIRMVVAAAFVWIVVAVAGKLPGLAKSLKDRGAIGRTFAGSITGPFLGVWMSMVAITYALTGVASTLMSLMPVMVIPVVWFLYRQKTSWRGAAGAAISVIGVAILFLL